MTVFQDSYHKQASNDQFSNAIVLASNSLEQAKHYIIVDSPDVMSLDYVESVAKFRYTLETVAWLLHDYYLDPAQFKLLSTDERTTVARLISSVKGICSTLDEYAPKDALIIADFLVKSIVRKYGMSTLMTLCKGVTNAEFLWLIPKHLQKYFSENQVWNSKMLLFMYFKHMITERQYD